MLDELCQNGCAARGWRLSDAGDADDQAFDENGVEHMGAARMRHAITVQPQKQTLPKTHIAFPSETCDEAEEPPPVPLNMRMYTQVHDKLWE